MSCSVLCIILVLRNVTISYPEIIDESDPKTVVKTETRKTEKIENIDAYEFPNVSKNKSSLLTARIDRAVRDDLKNFVTVKHAREYSPATPQRRDSNHSQNMQYTPNTQYTQNSHNSQSNRLNGYSPASGNDYYMESEEHSLVSDDGESEISRSDHRAYDHTEDSLIRESASNPSLLIGWQINAKGRGIGLILDMKKSLGRTTKFKVQFENGNIKLLSLKRSDKKGSVPFSLIMKVSN